MLGLVDSGWMGTVVGVTPAPTRRSARLVHSIVSTRQIGLIDPPQLQSAVGGIVAMIHRAIEVEAVVGRYTSFAAYTTGSSAIAVLPGRNRMGIAMGCLASEWADIGYLADTQSLQAPGNVRQVQQ